MHSAEFLRSWNRFDQTCTKILRSQHDVTGGPNIKLGFRAPVSGTHEIMATREHGDALGVRTSFLRSLFVEATEGSPLSTLSRSDILARSMIAKPYR